MSHSVNPMDVPLPDEEDEVSLAPNKVPLPPEEDKVALPMPSNVRSLTGDSSRQDIEKEDIERMKRRAARFKTPFKEPKKNQDFILKDPQLIASRIARWGKVDVKEDKKKSGKKKSNKKWSNFQGKYKLDPKAQIFEQVDEVDLEIERRSEALHICGTWISNRKTADILSFFSKYTPSYIEWISLYECNVVFSNAKSVKETMLNMSHPPLLTEEALSEKQKISIMEHSDVLTQELVSLWLWREVPLDLYKNAQPPPPPPETKKGKNVPVFLIRQTTVDDVKKHPSKRKGFNIYWKKFGRTMANEANDESMGQPDMGGRKSKKGRYNKKKKKNNYFKQKKI